MLKSKIQADQVEAMKAHDGVRLDTLRFILSEIKNVEIDTQKELTDEEVVRALRKEVKKLTDSIETFRAAGRTDLASEYDAQRMVLATYLPPEMSDADLKKDIMAIVEKNRALYDSNPAALIGICVKELKEKADPGKIAVLVKTL